jgi:hypothetical protein
MTESDIPLLTDGLSRQEENFVHPAIWDDFLFQQLSPSGKLYALLYLMRPERKAWANSLLGDLLGEEYNEDAEDEALKWIEELREMFLSTPHGASAPADQGEAGRE